jgi:hypothetical protein
MDNCYYKCFIIFIGKTDWTLAYAVDFQDIWDMIRHLVFISKKIISWIHRILEGFHLTVIKVYINFDIPGIQNVDTAKTNGKNFYISWYPSINLRKIAKNLQILKNIN